MSGWRSTKAGKHFKLGSKPGIDSNGNHSSHSGSQASPVPHKEMKRRAWLSTPAGIAHTKNDSTHTITRKKPCPKCQGDMTMKIDSANGYGSGNYNCRCGNIASQSQTEDDWVGASEKICVARYCKNKAGEKERLCPECIKQEAEDRWQ